MTGAGDDEAESDSTSYYRAYEGYEKTLRTWFVAYGIGAPILLLTDEAVRDAFTHSAQGRRIGGAFLVGVAVQVLLAIVNKTVAWANYYAATRPTVQGEWKYRTASWLSEQFWIDAIADLATVLLFGWATWTAFAVVTAAV